MSEEKDFRAFGYVEAEVVLASDEALAAFKRAIVEACKPPAPTATGLTAQSHGRAARDLSALG